MKNAVHRLKQDDERYVKRVVHGYQRIGLAEDLGYCYADSLQLDDGLLVNQLHYCPKFQLLEETKSRHAQPVMVLTVGLKGSSEYRSDNAEQVSFQADHITINTFPNIDGVRSYQQQQTVSQLRLIMSPQFLARYIDQEKLGDLFYHNHINKLAFQPVSATAKAHALALSHSLQQAKLQPEHRLQQHIHALSLLAEQLHILVPEQRLYPDCGLHQHDIQNLEQAKTMMINQLEQPLTVNFIAGCLGMNVHKFKTAFIKLYGVNPTEYLLELRMRKALTLLESGLQVSQVAWQVGYKYPNNFSVAFTRFYGCSPKTFFER